MPKRQISAYLAVFSAKRKEVVESLLSETVRCNDLETPLFDWIFSFPDLLEDLNYLGVLKKKQLKVVEIYERHNSQEMRHFTRV